jgi:hypothetical protein
MGLRKISRLPAPDTHWVNGPVWQKMAIFGVFGARGSGWSKQG